MLAVRQDLLGLVLQGQLDLLVLAVPRELVVQQGLPDLVLLDLPDLLVPRVLVVQQGLPDLVLLDLPGLLVLAVSQDLRELVELSVPQDLPDQLDLLDLRDHSFFQRKSPRAEDFSYDFLFTLPILYDIIEATKICYVFCLLQYW